MNFLLAGKSQLKFKFLWFFDIPSARAPSFSPVHVLPTNFPMWNEKVFNVERNYVDVSQWAHNTSKEKWTLNGKTMINTTFRWNENPCKKSR